MCKPILVSFGGIGTWTRWRPVVWLRSRARSGPARATTLSRTPERRPARLKSSPPTLSGVSMYVILTICGDFNNFSLKLTVYILWYYFLVHEQLYFESSIFLFVSFAEIFTKQKMALGIGKIKSHISTLCGSWIGSDWQKQKILAILARNDKLVKLPDPGLGAGAGRTLPDWHPAPNPKPGPSCRQSRTRSTWKGLGWSVSLSAQKRASFAVMFVVEGKIKVPDYIFAHHGGKFSSFFSFFTIKKVLCLKKYEHQRT
jgi:hypothetical protein